MSAARCGLPLRFTRGSVGCCVFEVCCYCERGVGRGSPRPRRLRRSRCRITLASKARLPDPPLLTRLHPPRTQASCSCGPRLQKRCWVRCGEPWRSPPRISPTTSDIVPGAVVRHPDDHPNPPHGTTRATETAKPTYLPIPIHPPPVLDRFSWPRVGDAPARSGKENQSPPHVFARTRELPA